MLRFYTLFSVIYFAFFLYVVLDVVLSEPSLVRNLPKLTWLFVVIIIPLVGGIAWLIGGRPLNTTATPGSTRSRSRAKGQHPSSRGRPNRPPPPKGPDDDPEFLRRLDERLRRDDTGDEA